MPAGSRHVLWAAMLAVIMASLLCSNLCVAQEPKFGKITMETVYRNSARLKKLVQSLQQLEANSRAKLAALVSEVENLQKKLKSEEDPLSEEERAKAQSQLEQKKKALEEEKQAIRVRLKFKGTSVRNSAKIMVGEAIAKVAQKKQLEAVFVDKAMPFSAGLPDITADVIEALETAPEPTVPTAPKPQIPDKKESPQPSEAN